jgi:hypothetical protein
MIDIHCYNCGGFIDDPSKVSHRVPGSMLHKTFGAPPTSALCTCTPPVLYGPEAGRAKSAGQARLN